MNNCSIGTIRNNFTERFVILSVAAVLLTIVAPTAAQSEDDACPVMVEQAIIAASDVCESLGSNEACYGNTHVIATDWEGVELDNFAQTGDKANVLEMASLTTFPLNIEDNTWGVAVLALQVNIPNTLPGQIVTFVLFGDVELSNEVAPDEVVISPPVLIGHSTGTINVRSGPGTNYDRVGSLTSGEEIVVMGRSEASDWLQIGYEGEIAWVATSLIELDGDVEILIPVDSIESEELVDTRTDPNYDAPMQAFHFSTGIRQPTCEEAIRGGLLIQAPHNLNVNFLINGVEFQVGSTVLLRVVDNQSSVRASTLDGSVGVSSGDDEIIVEAGQQLDIVLGGEATEPESYEYEDVRDLPLELLPDEVQLPAPAGTDYSMFNCAFIRDDEGLSTATAGEPLILVIGGASNTLQDADNTAQGAVVSLTYDGQEINLWSLEGPRQDGDVFRNRWNWVVPEPESGQHEIVLTISNSGSSAMDGVRTCTIAVA